MLKGFENNSKIQNDYVLSHPRKTEVLEQEGRTVLKYVQFSQKWKRFQYTVRDYNDLEIVLDCTEIYQILLINFLIYTTIWEDQI